MDEEPRIAAGPALDGLITQVVILDPLRVDQADYHDDLICLINAAFRTAKSRTNILNEEIRIPLDTQFSQHVSTGLGAFVLVLQAHQADGRNRILATVSARCRAIKPVQDLASQPAQHGQPLTADAVFSRFEIGHARDPTVVFWEMKLLAVDPTVQRKGLAGWLVNAVEEEIVRRCAQSDLQHKAIMHVVVLLTTIRELNGEFYRKRGYLYDSERHYEAGVLNSEGAFTVVHMSKKMAVHQ